jgi:hypothetical protein
MKLYNIYEDIILEGLITEGVDTQQIIDTIDGEYARNGKKFIRRIRIHYDGDDNKDKFGNVTREGKGWRNVVVHALGRHKGSGREVIRAYQVYGDSLRTPNDSSGWKLFRTDRISHWEPTNLKYWEPIEVAGQKTNMYGDESMIGNVKVVNFDDDVDTNDGIDVNNRNIDNTYRYDNADDVSRRPTTPSGEIEPEIEPEVSVDNTYQYDTEDNFGDIDREEEPKIDNDYEEEDVDDNDEIKDF